MNYLDLTKAFSNKRKGQIIRLQWKSEPKLSAMAKKLGYQVEKITESTVRFGVKYDNIKAVQQRKEATGFIRNADYKPWWNWKVPNIIKEHSSKGTLYLTLATLPKNSNSRVKYFVNGAEVSKEALINMNIVLPSYWKDSVAEVFDVNIENILKII